MENWYYCLPTLTGLLTYLFLNHKGPLGARVSEGLKYNLGF